MQKAVKRDSVQKVESEQAWRFELDVSTTSDGLGCSILEGLFVYDCALKKPRLTSANCVARDDLELLVLVCLHLPSADIKDMCHHALFSSTRN